MDLKDKLASPYLPVTFFEMVPPAAGDPAALEKAINEARKIGHQVDAINLPEIRAETRNESRAAKFVDRIEPRALGGRIRREAGLEVVLNRCVVHDADCVEWLRETDQDYGIDHVVLVGGESSGIAYPGLGVIEAAGRVAAAGLRATLGGISIPTRLHEPERVRRKAAAGLTFFTTQVLFDANDIVWLIQKLNGLEARIFLSFAPVTQARDLDFLRWLGADIPPDLDRFLLQGDGTAAAGRSALIRSLDLCQRILMDVFDNLPPDPPPIGLNIEHINRRNFGPALEMLDHLQELYKRLVLARAQTA
jgi:5,10-methylenetetrahydrofolate reductase